LAAFIDAPSENDRHICFTIGRYFDRRRRNVILSTEGRVGACVWEKERERVRVTSREREGGGKREGGEGSGSGKPRMKERINFFFLYVACNAISLLWS
jgi:predicted Zn-dependent protease